MNRYLTVNINMINQGYYDTKYMNTNTALDEHFFFSQFSNSMFRVCTNIYYWTGVNYAVV